MILSIGISSARNLHFFAAHAAAGSAPFDQARPRSDTPPRRASLKASQARPRGETLSAERIVARLREAEIEPSRGKKVPQAAQKIGVTEQTCCRWKKGYGGPRVDQAKRLKDLEQENARLKRPFAEAELDKAIPRGGPPREAALDDGAVHAPVRRSSRRKKPGAHDERRLMSRADVQRPDETTARRRASGRVFRPTARVAADVARRLTSDDVLERPSALFVRRGVPTAWRSDKGSEFTAHQRRAALSRRRDDAVHRAAQPWGKSLRRELPWKAARRAALP